jgi:membrane-bound lytic murein transglycosylase B
MRLWHTSIMINRRTLLTAAAISPLAAPAQAEPGISFPAYLDVIRKKARAAGISEATVNRSLKGVQPLQRVIDLDRNQPESKLTWQQYKSRLVSQARIARGRPLYAQHRNLLTKISAQYGVPASAIMGIWALESDYGVQMGNFKVIDCLITLCWEGRRRAYFEPQLLDALKIVDHGDIAPDRMIGSWAGAMGQTQFMPDVFIKYAVDYSGTGRRDIWTDMGDVFASTANCLSGEGWKSSIPWGRAVDLPTSFNTQLAGHTNRRSVVDWRKEGLTIDGVPTDTKVSVVLPGGPADEAYLAFYPSYKALRAYNPPDKYCISVGLLGDALVA